MILKRIPGPALRPFVTTLWASERKCGPQLTIVADRERVLPTGRMHLAFSLSAAPFHFFHEAGDALGHHVGHAVVGGARCEPYIREISGPSRSVGAEFHPGACEVLFGVRADELAGRHTPLDALWGRFARTTRERLLETRSPERQLDILESVLALRLHGIRALHPAVAHALQRFAISTDVRETVRQSGCSHRRFITLFRQATGLTPKRYCRVARFGRVLARIGADPDAALIDLAHVGDFSDQPHFNREFRQFAGVTPGAYRRLKPAQPHHVQIPR